MRLSAALKNEILLSVGRSLQSEVKNLNGRKMGKLSEAAARIKDTKKRLSDKGDEVLARLDILDHQEPKVFAAAHKVIDAQHADLTDLESEVRQLSNLEP